LWEEAIGGSAVAEEDDPHQVLRRRMVEAKHCVRVSIVYVAVAIFQLRAERGHELEDGVKHLRVAVS